jgi:hypothetical protein
LWRYLLLSGFALFSMSFVPVGPLRAPAFPGFAPNVPVPLVADSEASSHLEKAIAALSPPRVRWLSTSVWQQANVGPMVYVARGIFRSAPDGRQVLSLQLEVDGTQGQQVSTTGGGPLSLLTEMQERVIFFRHQPMRWNGRRCWLLTGAVRDAQPTDWPETLPRQCRLVLDAETHWPHRVEWWGPENVGQRDRLLIQVEFRDANFEDAHARQ